MTKRRTKEFPKHPKHSEELDRAAASVNVVVSLNAIYHDVEVVSVAIDKNVCISRNIFLGST